MSDKATLVKVGQQFDAVLLEMVEAHMNGERPLSAPEMTVISRRLKDCDITTPDIPESDLNKVAKNLRLSGFEPIDTETDDIATAS